MAITKETSIHFIKISILTLGIFAFTVGITPYIFSYFDSDEKPKFNIDASEEALSVISNQEAPQIESIETEEKTLIESPSSTSPNKVSPHKKTANTPKQNAKPVVLPALHESDDFFLNELNNASTESLFIPVDIVRNMVVFVDNFSRGEIIARFSPLHRPIKPFSVNKYAETMTIDSKSYLRYDKYAKIVDSIDTEEFIYLYKLLTPLIDEAYQEIGYPAGGFNDTFIKAIAQALDTPVIHYRLEVNSTSVMYKYVDENIESLPDTQKLLLRMGPNNLETVKNKLQSIQNELQRL